jgi:hypothetical protein
MISDALYSLADRIAGDVLQGHTPSQEELAAIAQQLMGHARTARIMETLPFVVADPLVDLLPEMVFVRAIEASEKRPWPSDLGGTQEQWR